MPTTTETIAATGMIMAAYAGNPTPSMSAEDLLNLLDKVHAKIAGFANSIEAASGEIMNEAARMSMAGSEVSIDAFDPVATWPEATPEQRNKFMTLINKHDIPIGGDGLPMTRKPRNKLVEDDRVFDPISGQPFTMLKRHLTTAYDLDEPELRAMFRLGDEFVITAPAYSASKAKQAADQGLGRSNKKKEDVQASREAAARKPRRRKAVANEPAADSVSETEPAASMEQKAPKSTRKSTRAVKTTATHKMAKKPNRVTAVA